MPADSDIRVIRGTLNEVSDELEQHLWKQGFKVERKAQTDSNRRVHFLACNGITSFWELLKTGAPQIIVIQLRAIDNDQTEVKLCFRSRCSFQVRLYGMLATFYLLIAGSIWVGSRFSPKNPVLAVGCVALPVFLLVTLASAWWLLLLSLHVSSEFFQALYDEMTANFGSRPTIVRSLNYSPEFPNTVAITLLSLLLLLLPFWEELGKYLGAVIIVITGVAIMALVIIPISIAKSATVRHVQSVLVINSSLTFLVYGLFPYWMPVVVLLSVFLMPKQSTPSLPKVGYFLAITLEMCFCYIMSVCIPVLALRKTAFRLVATVDFIKKHPEVVTNLTNRQRKAAAGVLLLFWSLLSLAQLLILYTCLSLLEMCLLKQHVLFPCFAAYELFEVMKLVLHSWFHYLSWPDYSIGITRILTLLYCLPILLWLGFMVGRNIHNIFRRFDKRRTRKEWAVGEHFKLTQVLQRICAFAGVRPPIALPLESEAIQASVDIPPIPGSRSLLTVSNGAMKALPPEQLEALLAHEVGHIKQHHVLLFGLANFVSRWTFMGEGFLAAWMQESFDLEREADAFAVKWLETGKRNQNGRQQLIELIRTLEKQRIMEVLHGTRDASYGVNATESDWLPPNLRAGVTDFQKKSYFEKWRLLVQLCRIFYFQGWQATYIYSSYTERIRYISNLPTKHPK